MPLDPETRARVLLAADVLEERAQRKGETSDLGPDLRALLAALDAAEARAAEAARTEREACAKIAERVRDAVIVPVERVEAVSAAADIVAQRIRARTAQEEACPTHQPTPSLSPSHPEPAPSSGDLSPSPLPASAMRSSDGDGGAPSTTSEAPANQCDGCMRGLMATHRDNSIPDWRDAHITACEAPKYVRALAEEVRSLREKLREAEAALRLIEQAADPEALSRRQALKEVRNIAQAAILNAGAALDGGGG